MIHKCKNVETDLEVQTVPDQTRPGLKLERHLGPGWGWAWAFLDAGTSDMFELVLINYI